MLRAMTTGKPPGDPGEGTGTVRVLHVPPGPVRGPRGGGRPGIVVLAGVVAAIAVAIGAAQLAPPAPELPRLSFALPAAAASAAAVSSADPATPPDASAPDASALLARTTPRLSRDALAAAVRDGSLDGRLVFVDGVLHATPMRCESPAQGPGGCVKLEIPGIGVPVHTDEGATPWPGDPPPGAWLVTVAGAGALVYLGSFLPTPGGPAVIGDLPIDGVAERDGTLLEARGYLVVNPVHPCDTRDVDATPCPAPPPFLADDEPLPDGIRVSDRGEQVGLASSMPEVDPAAVVTVGTFLVTRVPGTEGSWRVVARYEPSRAVRVLVP